MKLKCFWFSFLKYIFLAIAIDLCVTAGINAREIVYDSNLYGSQDIWAINSDGSNKLNLSAVNHDPASEFTEYEPIWSPDGRKIVFVSNKTGTFNVWIMNANGQNDYNLTKSYYAEYQANWSYDGKKIYYVGNTKYSDPRGCGSCPHWEVFVHHLETGVETQLTYNNSREMTPIPSPDGNFIVYAKAERPNDCCNATDVWIMNSDGSNQRLLLGWKDGKYEWPYHWGKFNNTILVAKHFDCRNTRCHEVTLVNPENSDFVRLTTNAYADVPKAFSPDESKILLVSKKSGNYDLWIMDINGSYIRNLTNDSAREYGGDWAKQNEPPIAICKDIEIQVSENCQAYLNAEDIDGGSYDPDEGDNLSLSIDNGGPFALGSHYVTLTVTDDSNESDTCVSIVTVFDKAAPIIDTLTATPNVLWPPNHKMVRVSVDAIVSDNCDANPLTKIISVKSNEMVDGTGDGDTIPDWEILGDLSVNLRSERSGKGTGRIYTITVMSSDASGNSSVKDVYVTVPHSKKK